MNSLERCFYRSQTYDPESKSPLYVLDTTFAPLTVLSNGNSKNDVNNNNITNNITNNTEGNYLNTDNNENQLKLDDFIDRLSVKAPTESHSLIIFTNGFYRSSGKNDESFKLPLNLIKILKSIPNNSKKKLIKVYIVHSNWVFKSMVDLINKFYGTNTQIINCENLSSLSHYIDITKIPISLHTYVIDKIQFKNKIILNRHFSQLYSRPLTIYSDLLPINQFQRIFNNLIAYLSNPDLDVQLSINDWTTIIKCSALSDETKISIDILSECLKRDQAIILSDYSFLEHYMIIIKFILKLSNSKYSLIPLELLLYKKDKNAINFDNINEVNSFLNEILIYRHPLTTDSLNNVPEIDSYDNSYMLIKIFKLFRYLLNKLEREANILEPQAKNLNKSVERQRLRLILAFTKILYNDSDDSISEEDDDIGFDNLFKLISSIMKHFDDLKIWNTIYTIDDFNNHISFDDFLAFENFKNKQLGITDIIETKIIDNRNKDNSISKNNKKNVKPSSPIKPKSVLTSINNNDLNNNSPDLISSPLPPPPRKSRLLNIENSSGSVNSDNSSSSLSSKSSNDSINNFRTNANISISISKSKIDSITKSVESLGIEDEKENINEIDLFKTPKNKRNNEDSDIDTANDMVDLITPTRQISSTTIISSTSTSTSMTTPQFTVSIDSLASPRKVSIPNKPVKPEFLQTLTPQKNINLRKYTEKDLAVQQAAEKAKLAAIKQKEHAKEVEKGVRRGERKVSRLARLYEEKYQL